MICVTMSAAASEETSVRQLPELQVIWLVIPLKKVIQAPVNAVVDTVNVADAVVVLIPVLLVTVIVVVDSDPSVNVTAAGAAVAQFNWKDS